MQRLGLKVEGVLRYRSQDEQAILLEGLTFDEFRELDDDLNTLVQVDLPEDELLGA